MTPEDKALIDRAEQIRQESYDYDSIFELAEKAEDEGVKKYINNIALTMYHYEQDSVGMMCG